MMANTNTFARTIARWGQQKAAEAPVEHRTTLAIAGYFRGTLRVEGISLQHGGVAALEELVRSHGMCEAIQALELVRCDLGGTVSSVSPATGETPPTADEQQRSAASVAETQRDLLRLLQRTPNLRSLDLSCNFIDNEAFHGIIRVGCRAVIIGRRIFEGTATCQQQFFCHLVVWHIGGDG